MLDWFQSFITAGTENKASDWQLIVNKPATLRIDGKNVPVDLTLSDDDFKALMQDLEYQLFSRFFNIIFSDMPKPELLVYLYSDVERLQKNIRKRGRSYEQEISNDYLNNIQQGYFEFLRQQQGNMRILILDTNELDFVANEKHYQMILDAIDRPYDIGIHRISF